MASMPSGDAATTPGGTGGRTRRASGFSGRGAGRRGAGTTGETAPDGRELRVSIRACNASSCAASRCVVAVASASARTSGASRRDGACSIFSVSAATSARACRTSASSVRARCGLRVWRAGVRPRPPRVLVAAARRGLRPDGARAARRPRPALPVRVARGVRRAARRPRASRRPPPSSAPHPHAGAPLPARRAPSRATRAASWSPRSRRSNRSNATTRPRPNSAPSGRHAHNVDASNGRSPRSTVAATRSQASPSPHCASTPVTPGCAPNRASTRSRNRSSSSNGAAQ